MEVQYKKSLWKPLPETINRPSMLFFKNYEHNAFELLK